jgi:RNA-directed DNA polymerase
MSQNWPQDPSAAFIYKKLLESYCLCVKGKPSLKSTHWHWRVEKELYHLSSLLNNKRYRPGLSSIFVVLNPKPREVIAANIRDRVVHRMMCDYMAPYWEKRFLPNSFACRKGKGPLAAVSEVEKFVKSHQHNTSVPLYYLKIDVSRFFPSIDHEILLKYLAKHLENDFFVWLLKIILRHRPTDPGCYRMDSSPRLWDQIEPEKSLFRIPRGKGLPIGNLTSQFFANVYMHPLDLFLAKARKGNFLYWQRYVDDVLILGENKKFLADFVLKINEFLQHTLALQLNPRKTVLQPLCHGLDHLGYFIKPTHTEVRRSVKKRAEHRLRNPAVEKGLVQSGPLRLAGLQAALGHAQKGKNLRWRWWLVYLARQQKDFPKFSVDPLAQVVRTMEPSLKQAMIDDLWKYSSGH